MGRGAEVGRRKVQEVQFEKKTFLYIIKTRLSNKRVAPVYMGFLVRLG